MTNLTFGDLARKINSEAEAYEYLESLRWPGKPVCPHCGVETDHYFLKPANGLDRKTRTGHVSQRRVWKCRSCRKQFSALTGTIFHGSKIPLQTWLLVFFEMCCNKNGIAAREIARRYGVAPKTAWFMTHRIREAMKSRGVPFSGDVVADETYIGGDPANQHLNKRTKRDTGKAAGTAKTPVVSLIDDDTGVARSTAVPWVDSASIRKIMKDNVDLATTVLHTDSATVYVPVARSMAGHFAVNHHAGEYVSEKSLGTQKVENFFSQLKRSLDGTHHSVSVEHLPRYLAEFDFRYSTRKLSDTQRMALLMTRVPGRRLSYRPLIQD
ncbi:MAG: IS1595 family transposase [Acidimicrobiales bacterium]